MKVVLNIHDDAENAVEVGGGVTNKALTSNVATLTTAEAHGLVVDDVVVVAGVDAVFDGEFTVASVPTATTFTYAKTNANVASAADTGTVSRVPTHVLLDLPGGRRGRKVLLQNNGPGDVHFDFTEPDGELADVGVILLAASAPITVELDGDLYLTTDADDTDFRYALGT